MNKSYLPQFCKWQAKLNHHLARWLPLLIPQAHNSVSFFRYERPRSWAWDYCNTVIFYSLLVKWMILEYWIFHLCLSNSQIWQSRSSGHKTGEALVTPSSCCIGEITRRIRFGVSHVQKDFVPYFVLLATRMCWFRDSRIFRGGTNPN